MKWYSFSGREDCHAEGEVIEDRILYSLIVSLRLGEARDVVLGLGNVTRYGRKDSAFLPVAGAPPRYQFYKNTLRIDYPAGSPSDNRIFFNLKGHGVGNVEDHDLAVYAGRFLWPEDASGAPGAESSREQGSEGKRWIPEDAGEAPWAVTSREQGSGEERRIPEGLQAVSVEGTPLDFRQITPIDVRIRVGYEPLVRRHGYDHLYLLDDGEEGAGEAALCHAATLRDHARTLRMEVYTSFPALYVYTGNRFSGKDIGKGGCIYPVRGGIMLAPVEVSPEGSAGSMEGGRIPRPSQRGGIVEYRFYPMEQDFSKDVKGR